MDAQKDGKFKETKDNVIPKAKKMTFDDLWDWRLHKGNIFIGKEMKDTIAVFGQSAVGSPTRPLLQTSRETKLEMGVTDEAPKKENFDTDNEDLEDEADKQLVEMRNRYKKNMADLEKWAGMDNLEIAKEIEKKKDKKKTNNMLNKIGPLIGNMLPIAEKEAEKAERKVRAKMKETMIYNFQDDQQSFEISDDEDLAVKKSARDRNNIANKKLNDEIKADEDFKRIGDAIIGQSELNRRGNPVLKEVKQDKTVFDNFLGSSGKKGEAGADVPAIKVAIKSDDPKKKTEFKEDKDKDKDQKDGKEKKDNDKAKDEKKKESTPEEETEKAKFYDSLANNPAFRAIQTLIMTENSILEKLGQKKKKKKRSDEDEEKISPEEKLEERIAKYYQKMNYDYLKLEPGFQYDIIPPPAFNSILDILPNMVKNANQAALDKKIKEQESIRLTMTYTMSELKKKKTKKKKTAAERKKEANEKRIQSQSRANMGQSGSMGASTLRAATAESDVSMTSYDESQDQPSFRDSQNKGSEAKKARKKLFEENEKFIRKKPFPMPDGERKSEILSAMTDSTFNFMRPIDKALEQQTARTDRTSSSKRVGGDANVGDEVQGFIDRFKKDSDDDVKEDEHMRLKDPHYDYELLYLNIRAGDMVEDLIEKYNWSGNDLMGPVEFSLSQTDKAIDSLNVQKLDVWLSGCMGVLLTSRRYSREFVDSSAVNMFLMISVFLNTLILGADGLAPDSWSDIFSNMNLAFTIIFTAELCFKLYGYGPKKYIKDAFNVFDAFVVTLSLVELVINAQSDGQSSSTSGFRAVRIFRIFRVLRVTRLLRSLRFMKVIIEVMKNTAEQFGYMVLLMFLFIFIFTLLGTQVFGGTFKFNVYPYNIQRYNFDSFQSAFFTVFTILTVENWNGILINTLRSTANSILAVFYLIVWIFIGNYIFVNLFLSILLDGFESTDAMQQIDEIEHESKELERTHKRLIEKNEKKKILDQIEKEKAIEQVLLIIDPKKYQSKLKIKKNQAAYLVTRDSEQDEPSLSEDLDMAKICNHLQKGKAEKQDPYEGVDCIKSLYYFTQQNPIRLFCARVVSHPK